MKMVRAKFISELKNRFRCTVNINGKETLCYVPSSSKLSNFIDLTDCTVLLRPMEGKSGIKYSLYAAETENGTILLNLVAANEIIAGQICDKMFSFLGDREHLRRETVIDGYKSDLYIEDSDTIVEIKTVLSLDSKGHFPTGYSVRLTQQLKNLKRLLRLGHRVCYIFVALAPNMEELYLDTDKEYIGLFRECLDNGMRCIGCNLQLTESGFTIASQIEIMQS